MKLLEESDYTRAAAALQCDVPAIKAVAEVESRGAGFMPDGRPKVLFEGHHFHLKTGGKYDATHPSISYWPWTQSHYRDERGEWDRLTLAMSLDRSAAIQSASWGKFQVMGFNFSCAYKTLEEFFTAMHDSEGCHLDAFIGFVKQNNLAKALREHRWADFARGYNGEGYAANSYDKKLLAVWSKYGGGVAVQVPTPPTMPSFKDLVAGTVQLTKVIINGTELTTEAITMSYLQVCLLAKQSVANNPTVTWSTRDGRGKTMVMGDTVKVEPGMVFNALVTGSA